MANSGIFRNVNIIKELNASTGTQMIELYQPGRLNALDIVNNAKYSGFITSLRLTVDIASIDELEVVENDTLADDAIIAANAKITFNNNAKKCLSFFIGNSDTPPIKVVDVFIFNQRPFYYVSLLPYFTGASTFDIAPDSIIAVQQRNVGYGLLQDDDRVLILGAVIEESPIYDQSVLHYLLKLSLSFNMPDVVADPTTRTPAPTQARPIDYHAQPQNVPPIQRNINTGDFIARPDILPRNSAVSPPERLTGNFAADFAFQGSGSAGFQALSSELASELTFYGFGAFDGFRGETSYAKEAAATTVNEDAFYAGGYVAVTNTKLEIHITKYEGDKEYIYLYRLNDNEKTIEHKFNRLANWITQVAGFLHRKTGFHIRDDKF